MKVDNFGKVQVTDSEAFEALYSGKIEDLSSIFIDNFDSVQRFNSAVKENADSINLLKHYTVEEDVDMFDEANRCSWFMPEKYLNFPMEDWLHEQCKTPEEHDRVHEELTLFIQHDAFDVLFYLKYLVDTMRENKIVWGVGRGSSVASYVLYLIGVHKINSLKYNLDIKEFLKEGE